MALSHPSVDYALVRCRRCFAFSLAFHRFERILAVSFAGRFICASFPVCEVSSPQPDGALDPNTGVLSDVSMRETPLAPPAETALVEMMSEDRPRSYRQRAMRFPPRRRKRSRSHSSALLDNGSPNNASRRPARPIFELNLW